MLRTCYLIVSEVPMPYVRVPALALLVLLLSGCVDLERPRTGGEGDDGVADGRGDVGDGGDEGVGDGGDEGDADGEDGCVGELVLCGSACVDTATADEHCGGCDRPCGGGKACVGGTCVGSPCGGCEPGTWCDAEAELCRPGCARDADCPQPGRCDLDVHWCECATGHHLCGDVCVPDDDVRTCGARCEACPGTAHGEASCAGGVCGVRCEPGYHDCGGACVSNDSPASCGGACQPCSTPWNGSATCDGQMCGVSCNPGFHRCGDQCLSNSSTQSCGNSCSPCPAVVNGSATCDGFSCGVQCSSGYAKCSGACVAESVTSCGASCATCTQAPANASPDCADGACGFRCQPGYLRYGTGCVAATGVGVAAGFSCATVSGGGVRCWSSDVTGLSSGVTAISGGDAHACAIRNGGAVCWGTNGSGQLGNGSYTASTSPVAVTALSSGVTSISAGSAHTCAVAGGVVRCWGSGGDGRLGHGALTASNTPVSVAIPATVTQVAAGGRHTCALTSTGDVYCWGLNLSAQLGIDPATTRDCGTDFFDTECKSSPGKVTSISGAVALAAGSEHSCAIVAGGNVKCWGGNRWNEVTTAQCKRSYNDICLAPKDSLAGKVASAIVAGNEHTCALVSGGAVWCWGYNDYGEIGNGTSGHYGAAPATAIASGAQAIASSAGARHNCALVSGGGVKCWGYNSGGQLGDGTRTNRTSPVDAFAP